MIISCWPINNFIQVQRETAAFIRHLLKSKNIIILQVVYSHLTEIYESSLISLADIDPFTNTTSYNKPATENDDTSSKTSFIKAFPLHRNLQKREAEKIIQFSLGCLSELINARGSVLSMWALDPSLFTLLVNHSGLLEKVSCTFL